MLLGERAIGLPHLAVSPSSALSPPRTVESGSTTSGWDRKPVRQDDKSTQTDAQQIASQAKK